MGVLLSIYTQNTYREHMLQAVRNQDENIFLNAEMFGLKEDYNLRLENKDERWFFLDEDSEIKVDGNPYNGEELKDSVNYIIINRDSGDIIAITVRIQESFFSVYEKYYLTEINTISIGSTFENDIQVINFIGNKSIVSEKHAVMSKSGNNWIIEGLGVNGTFVNDSKIVGKRVLNYGDIISIWGLKMIFLGDFLAINASDSVKLHTKKLINVTPDVYFADREKLSDDYIPEDTIFFHRSPRSIEKIFTDTIDIEMPPAQREDNDTPLFMLVGPSFTMMLPMLLGSGMAMLNSGSTGGSFMYTGIITAVSSGALGVFWAITNLRFQKKKNKEEETKRIDAYSNYLMKCADDIKDKYVTNTRILNERYPEPNTLLGWTEAPELLWQRNTKHEDFLYHRIGIGNIPFQVDINIPKDRFSIGFDTLSDKPKFIKDQYSILENVPIGINIAEESLIGIVGGLKKAGAYQVIQSLVTQIATFNAYTEVKLVLLADTDEKKGDASWEYLSWLPHVWSADKKFRYTAFKKDEVSEVCYELVQILRQRSEENTGSEKRTFLPYYIIIVEDYSILEGELLSKYLLNEDHIGVTTFVMVEKASDLPNQCNRIIQNDGKYSGFIDLNLGTNEGLPVKMDCVEADKLLEMSKSMASVKLNESEIGGEIPSSLTFFEMYRVDSLEGFNVKERWRKNRIYESMKALIGVKTGGQECYLDLHEKYHGPHGLVAGTTGSGKSETLQTYLLSLAINFSPDDVGLFIIDFKGGGMGNLFTGLPHVLGQISNLSGNQVRRAMVSIKSENTRRQLLFNQNGVNNINAYTRLYKNGETPIPIPHLFIVIDEFAELKREEPEFMQELISVAQVGRSLGVHLILATQKPSGTVDDNIWSNTKFRLCLRVQDRQDSMDMLHKPDAAFLTQAGRGYLQVGNDEIYELFQSGWSGAGYDGESGGFNQEMAKMITNTGRTAIVGNHIKSLRKMNASNHWYECLVDIMGKVLAEGVNADNIVSVMFDKMNNNGMEYKYSDYNVGLIKNFCILYLENCSKYTKTDELSKAIQEDALRQGMKLPEHKEKTQLEAIVEYLGKVYQEGTYQKQQPLWLPVLPERIELNSIISIAKEFDGWHEQEEKWRLNVSVGLCDDPENQYQMPLNISFGQEGNHAICGIGLSGKSTFIQTAVYGLINKYSPKYLNLYILDFSNRMLEPFEEAPHVGGVLYENDIDTVGKFFSMLKAMIKERKSLFKGGNYYQYIMKNGLKCPAVLVVIDNIANFREKTEEAFDEDLIQISKECVANGIYLLISAAGFGVTEISGKLSENIMKTISLEMTDKYSYSDILKTMNIAIVPDSGIHGRGLVKIEDRALEFQTCVACEGENDYERIEIIRDRCTKMYDVWKGTKARRIPRIPEKPIWSEYSVLDSLKEVIEKQTTLPFGYDVHTADIIGMNLKSNYCYMVIGKTRSGKTNLLKIMTRTAKMIGSDTFIVEFGEEELLQDSIKTGCEYIHNLDEYIELMDKVIKPQIGMRARKRKELMAAGMDEDEIYEQMKQFKPIFIFISNLILFTKMMYEPVGKEKDLAGLMTNYFDRGMGTNLFFVADFNIDNKSDVIGKGVFDAFMKYRNGVHLGGNADAQNILDFSFFKYSELKNSEKTGVGYCTGTENEPAIKVVTPFVGK